MKTKTKLVLATLFVVILVIFELAAHAQTTNLPGVLAVPYPGAATLSTIQSNINAHLVSWSNSANQATLSLPSTNGWVIGNAATNSSSQLFYTNKSDAQTGFYNSNVSVLPGGSARFQVSYTVGPIGWGTNTYWFWGLLKAPDVTFSGGGTSTFKAIGFQAGGTNITDNVGGHISGVSHSSSPWWSGYNIYTNGTYTPSCNIDASNFSFVFVAPGHTNELRYKDSISFFNPTFTNYFAMYYGNAIGTSNSGPLLNAISVRMNGSETISNRVGEGREDFVVWSNDRKGDNIRISEPKSMDSGTNVPDLLLFCHGNTGTELDTFDAADPQNGTGVRDYFNLLNSNNIVVASYGDNVNGNNGRTDTWGTTNAVHGADSLLLYCIANIPYRNLFVEGDSAGGQTALNFLARHRFKVSGLIMHHAVYSSSNTYSAGINTSDVNVAFGGSSLAQLATTTNSADGNIISGDSRGIGTNAFNSVPLFCDSSFGDTTVRKTNQTDLMVTAVGGTVAVSNALPVITTVTNSLGIEVTDLGVNGAGGTHGDLTWSSFANTNIVNFIQRCRIYSQNQGNIPTPGGNSPTTIPPGVLTPPTNH